MLLEAPFTQDLKLFEALESSRAKGQVHPLSRSSTESFSPNLLLQTLILVQPSFTLSLPDKHKDITEAQLKIVDIANRVFAKVISVSFGGAFLSPLHCHSFLTLLWVGIFDWLVLFNPELSASKIFYYPFGDKEITWVSLSDMVEAIAILSCYPERSAYEGFTNVGRRAHIVPSGSRRLASC